MKRALNILRIVSFAITVLTSVPLIVHYITNQEPQHEFVTRLHVLFGVIFIITAIPSMIMQRKAQKM